MGKAVTHYGNMYAVLMSTVASCCHATSSFVYYIYTSIEGKVKIFKGTKEQNSREAMELLKSF